MDRYTQPTSRGAPRPFLNPTKKVGGSFILSLHRGATRPFRNPTNEVGGSFILSLHRMAPRARSGIPPTMLVDRSYPAYIARSYPTVLLCCILAACTSSP